MCVQRVVCLCVLALHQAGDLCRVYPASRSMTAGVGSSPSSNPDRWKRVDGTLQKNVYNYSLMKLNTTLLWNMLLSTLIIHQELYKSVQKISYVVDVGKRVALVRARALNHRQFVGLLIYCRESTSFQQYY